MWPVPFPFWETLLIELCVLCFPKPVIMTSLSSKYCFYSHLPCIVHAPSRG